MINDTDNSKQEKFYEDKKNQIEYFLSCINSEMPFGQLLFLIERLGLPNAYFKEAFRESNVLLNTKKEKEKEKEKENMSAYLQEMKKSVWKTIELCFEIMNEIDPVTIKQGDESDDNRQQDSIDKDWRHQVLTRLISNAVTPQSLLQSQCPNDANRVTTPSKSHVHATTPGSIGTMKTEWSKDSKKLNFLVKSHDLDSNEYFETMKLIKIQENRLNNEFYGQVRQINKALFANKVCIIYLYLLHLCIRTILTFVFDCLVVMHDRN